MSEAMLPKLPFVVEFEEELPKGHKDKLPKAYVGKEGMPARHSFNATPKKKKTA